jgi:hypothetical protein
MHHYICLALFAIVLLTLVAEIVMGKQKMDIYKWIIGGASLVGVGWSVMCLMGYNPLQAMST